ncbi:alpha/beta hydrolase, partial [Salmonella enterica]|nr:alpha/beta hydrolase [Salmonella enterica]
MSQHLIDPELLGVLPFLSGEVSESADGLQAAREKLASLLPPYRPLPGVDREERFVPGPPGAPDVRLLVYRPIETAGGSLPAVLHMHGGGFCTGSADMGSQGHAALAAKHRCVVVSVDYRLTPETRFPGNIDDCWA